MLRRKFLLATTGLAALAVVGGCTLPGGETMTLDQVVAKIKETCQFSTSWQNIAAVVVTVLSGFNATAGAASAIAVGVANQVITLVCNAVQTRLSGMAPNARAATPHLDVVVNGVTIHGDYVGK